MTKKQKYYAQTTRVPVSQTKSEIEKLVLEHGAISFAFMMHQGVISVAFSLNDRNILFKLPIPDDPQEERARWRCLLMTIKSKFESAKAGIETFEEAFLPQTVMPTGETVAEATLPVIESHYRGGTSVPLLPSA